MERVFVVLIVTEAPGPIVRFRQSAAAEICGIFETPAEMETSVVLLGTALEHQFDAVFQSLVVPNHPPPVWMVILTGTVVPVQPPSVATRLNQVVCARLPGV